VIETYSNTTSELNRGRKASSPFRLLGQYADEETGLCYTRFRYFDPEVGRWCSPDPLGIAGGNNLLAFDGSPTAVVDPLGLATTGTPHGKGALSEAMKDAPLQSSQGAVSGPAVDAYRERLRNGEVPPPIKVDGNVIVEGHHRYAAARLEGV